MGRTTIKPLNMADLKSEINIILDIYNEAWNKNWGFVPMTVDEIDAMAKELKIFANPDFIYILYQEEKPAAFILALPDLNNALINVKSGKLFPGRNFQTSVFPEIYHRRPGPSHGGQKNSSGTKATICFYTAA